MKFEFDPLSASIPTTCPLTGMIVWLSEEEFEGRIKEQARFAVDMQRGMDRARWSDLICLSAIQACAVACVAFILDWALTP